MKQLITMALLLASLQATAQNFTGSYLFEGNVGFTRYADDHDYDVQSSSVRKYFTLNLSAGKFISNSSLIGLNVSTNITNSRFKNGLDPEDDLIKSHRLFIGPYYKKLIPLSDKFYAGIHFDALLSKGTESNFNDEFDTKGVLLAVKPELTYFINDRWGITGTFGNLSYNLQRIDNNQGTADRESVDVNFGLSSFVLGVRYVLNKK